MSINQEFAKILYLKPALWRGVGGYLLSKTSTMEGVGDICILNQHYGGGLGDICILNQHYGGGYLKWMILYWLILYWGPPAVRVSSRKQYPVVRILDPLMVYDNINLGRRIDPIWPEPEWRAKGNNTKCNFFFSLSDLELL